MVKNGFVKKTGKKYSLGKEGKKLVNYINFEKLNFVEQPLIILGVLIKNKDRIITSSSKKEPIKDLWGLSCFAKFEIGENINDALKKACRINLGLEVTDFKFAGLFNIKTLEEDKMIYHNQFLVFTSDKFIGKIISETKFRKNKWVTLKQLKKLRQYPENEFIINNINKKKFFEIERNIDGKASFKHLYSL